MGQNVIYVLLDIFLLDRTANKSGQLPFTSTQSLSALSTIDSSLKKCKIGTLCGSIYKKYVNCCEPVKGVKRVESVKNAQYFQKYQKCGPVNSSFIFVVTWPMIGFTRYHDMWYPPGRLGGHFPLPLTPQHHCISQKSEIWDNLVS